MQVLPYYSVNPERDGAVFHESDDCMPGMDIRFPNLRSGWGPTGQYPFCRICDYLLNTDCFELVKHSIGGPAYGKS